MIVPQLLAEMDGVEVLDNVIIIGASNRADMIDPAVLRPGRLDVRIRVDRPDRTGARDIFLKHLNTDVPLHDDEIGVGMTLGQALENMVDQALDVLFCEDETTALFDAVLASGRTKRIHLGDIVSGAMIAGIVERAKKHAIKESLTGGGYGLSAKHLLAGVKEEMGESIELAVSSSADDWARTIGLREEIASIVALEA